MTGTKLLPLRVRRYSTFGRNDAVILAVDQAAFGERLQFAAEHARRDFRTAVEPPQQPRPDLAIAPRPILQIPDDPKLVLAADKLLERRDRTGVRLTRFRPRHAVTSASA